jgi:di/tricarboxylate transporter
MSPLLLLAAAASKVTVWEKIKAVPKESWLSLGATLLILIVIVKLWKNLREVGEIVPWLVLVLLGGSVVLYTTYERTEPKILTPLFNELAKVLPSKIEYKESAVPVK